MSGKVLCTNCLYVGILKLFSLVGQNAHQKDLHNEFILAYHLRGQFNLTEIGAYLHFRQLIILHVLSRIRVINVDAQLAFFFFN